MEVLCVSTPVGARSAPDFFLRPPPVFCLSSRCQIALSTPHFWEVPISVLDLIEHYTVFTHPAYYLSRRTLLCLHHGGRQCRCLGLH